MAFITNGELTYFNNLDYTIEVLTAYGFGIFSAVLMEHLYIYFGRRSLFSNPANLIAYSLIIIGAVTVVQYQFPNHFVLYSLISQALDVEGNLLVALAADYVASMVSLLILGIAYNFLFWREINHRFRWVNAERRR